MAIYYILAAILIALIIIKFTFWQKDVRHDSATFIRSFFRIYTQHRIYTTSTLAKSRFMKASNIINIIMFFGLLALIIVMMNSN